MYVCMCVWMDVWMDGCMGGWASKQRREAKRRRILSAKTRPTAPLPMDIVVCYGFEVVWVGVCEFLSCLYRQMYKESTRVMRMIVGIVCRNMCVSVCVRACVCVRKSVSVMVAAMQQLSFHSPSHSHSQCHHLTFFPASKPFLNSSSKLSST